MSLDDEIDYDCNSLRHYQCSINKIWLIFWYTSILELMLIWHMYELINMLMIKIVYVIDIWIWIFGFRTNMFGIWCTWINLITFICDEMNFSLVMHTCLLLVAVWILTFKLRWLGCRFNSSGWILVGICCDCDCFNSCWADWMI